MSKQIVAHANGIALLMLTALLVIVGGVIWELTQSGEQARLWVQETQHIIELVQDLDIAAGDAETGQRGFLLTDQDSYLRPYQSASGRVMQLHGDLVRLTADYPAQQVRLAGLAILLHRKLDEMALTVQLRRTDGFEAAMEVVRSDLGLRLMDQIRATLNAMRMDEQIRLRDRLTAATERDAWMRIAMMAVTALATLVVVGAVTVLHHSWTRYYTSERRQRLLVQQLRATLDSLEQGVAVFDADGLLVNWNSEFQHLLGLPKAMVRTGMPYAAFMEHTADATGPMLPEENDMRYERALPDGATFGLRRTSTPSGGFVLTVSDLTRPAQADAVLQEAQRMRTLGHLTGGIAHAFNNLLTVVLGNLEILGQGVGHQAGLQGRVDQAAIAAREGVQLTAKLLTFARGEALAPAALDMAGTVLELLPLLRRTLGSRIEIRYRAEPSLWTVHVDESRLECALLDLALNARDAMPDGGQLTVELANHATGQAGGGYVSLSVSDSGAGAAPGVLEHAFEPFRAAQHGGLGIGLATVARFAEHAGGYVEIASSRHRGTVARLCLPRSTAPAPAPAAPLTLQLTAIPAGSATVLVVEDEAAVRDVACAMLTSAGYRVLQAGDGAEALRLFGEHASEVDVLVTDLLLPGEINGRQVAERITAIRPGIRVVFASGYNQAAVANQGWDANARLIVKPFTHDQLASAVAASLLDQAARVHSVAGEAGAS